MTGRFRIFAAFLRQSGLAADRGGRNASGKPPHSSSRLCPAGVETFKSGFSRSSPGPAGTNGRFWRKSRTSWLQRTAHRGVKRRKKRSLELQPAVLMRNGRKRRIAYGAAPSTAARAPDSSTRAGKFLPEARACRAPAEVRRGLETPRRQRQPGHRAPGVTRGEDRPFCTPSPACDGRCGPPVPRPCGNIQSDSLCCSSDRRTARGPAGDARPPPRQPPP